MKPPNLNSVKICTYLFLTSIRIPLRFFGYPDPATEMEKKKFLWVLGHTLTKAKSIQN